MPIILRSHVEEITIVVEGADGKNQEAKSMAEGSPSKEINQVEARGVIGAQGEGSGLGEVIEIGGPSGLGRDGGIKVGLTPLIREKDKASEGEEASSGGRHDNSRIESSLCLHDISAS